MPRSLTTKNQKTSVPLCKHCKKRPRVTLFYCQFCRERHNARTRKLKRLYRSEGKCTMCGKKSTKVRCPECYAKEREYEKNSPWVKSKISKRGQFASIQQLMRLI